MSKLNHIGEPARVHAPYEGEVGAETGDRFLSDEFFSSCGQRRGRRDRDMSPAVRACRLAGLLYDVEEGLDDVDRHRKDDG